QACHKRNIWHVISLTKTFRCYKLYRNLEFKPVSVFAMRKRLIAALGILVLILNNFVSTGQHQAQGRGAVKIDLEVRQFMTAWNLQGGSLALIKNGRLGYCQAFGNADIAVPMQEDHLFRIASLSKPITGVAVMKLVESGLIGL